MAAKKTSKARAVRPLSSAKLKAVHKRVKASDLSAADKKALAQILAETIKLRQLVERSRAKHGRKSILASLPFGFDIVK